MIVNTLVHVFTSVMGWLLAQVPSVTWPSWLTGTGPGTLAGSVDDVSNGMRAWGNWFPLWAVALAVPAVLVCLTVSFGVKVARIVLSLFTAGGGSAG